jgi:3-hydroxyisobutyrate dehydrogenase
VLDSLRSAGSEKEREMASNEIAVAVLGTGIMGAPMARNLRAAGFEVRVWNRTRENAEPLSGDGITVANTPSEAVEGAEFAITMLADAGTVEGVVGAEGGVFSGISDGGVWVQMSTVGPEGHERLAEISRSGGVTYVDAPVLGTKEPAEQGQLVVLASGPEGVRERCEPVFGAVGSKTVWLGKAGAGSRMKVVVNNWLTGLLGVLAETISLADGVGVEPEKFLEIIEGGPLGAPYARLKGNMMLKEEFPTSFSAKLARKDTGLVLEAARQNGLSAEMAEAVAVYFDQAIEAGYGEQDMAAILEGLKKSG